MHASMSAPTADTASTGVGHRRPGTGQYGPGRASRPADARLPHQQRHTPPQAGLGGARVAQLPSCPQVQAAVAAVTHVHPSFSPTQLVRRKGPLVVLAGTAGRAPAIAKCVVADENTEAPHPDREQRALEQHRCRLRREIEAYRVFVRQRPPARLPRLIAADNVRDVLVVEQLPGVPAGATRHPQLAPQHIHVQAILGVCGTVNMWQPSSDTFENRLDYPKRIGQLHRLGLLTDRDSTDLQQLMRGLAQVPRQFCHGNPVLNHVLLSPGGPALLDWSSAGWYLPGRDLAVLWAVLHADPLARRRISQAAHFQGSAARDAFLVNLVLVLTEELHRYDSPEADEEQRLLIRRLHDDRDTARQAARTAAGVG